MSFKLQLWHIYEYGGSRVCRLWRLNGTAMVNIIFTVQTLARNFPCAVSDMFSVFLNLSCGLIGIVDEFKWIPQAEQIMRGIFGLRMGTFRWSAIWTIIKRKARRVLENDQRYTFFVRFFYCVVIFVNLRFVCTDITHIQSTFIRRLFLFFFFCTQASLPSTYVAGGTFRQALISYVDTLFVCSVCWLYKSRLNMALYLPVVEKKDIKTAHHKHRDAPTQNK